MLLNIYIMLLGTKHAYTTVNEFKVYMTLTP